MKSTNDAPTQPAKPYAHKRPADRSLFANSGPAILPSFEDPADLAFVRAAAEAVIQPANDLERLFAEQVIRSFCRSLRLGKLETAAIDVQMADHQDAARSQWGNIDPESLHHLSVREPATRAAKLGQITLRLWVARRA